MASMPQFFLNTHEFDTSVGVIAIRQNAPFVREKPPLLADPLELFKERPFRTEFWRRVARHFGSGCLGGRKDRSLLEPWECRVFALPVQIVCPHGGIVAQVNNGPMG